jgi:bifunctional enzyme CysN/CysC
VIDRLEYRVEVNSLDRQTDATELSLNEIGRVHLRTSTPLVVDPYSRNRITGSFILIDESTNDTVGAGMIRSAR